VTINNLQKEFAAHKIKLLQPSYISSCSKMTGPSAAHFIMDAPWLERVAGGWPAKNNPILA